MFPQVLQMRQPCLVNQSHSSPDALTPVLPANVDAPGLAALALFCKRLALAALTTYSATSMVADAFMPSLAGWHNLLEVLMPFA